MDGSESTRSNDADSNKNDPELDGETVDIVPNGNGDCDK